MTRRLRSNNNAMPGSSSQQLNHHLGRHHSGRPATNSKAPTSGITFPPTLSRDVDPGSRLGSQIRSSHNPASVATHEVSDSPTCRKSHPTLTSEISDILGAVGESSTLPPSVADRNIDKLTCRYPSRRESATGGPKVCKLQQRIRPQEATMHGPEDHANARHFHGNGRSQDCLRRPDWVPIPSNWSSAPFWVMPTSTVRHHTIPAAHGFALTLKPGARLRIVDLHGQQVVDFMAWAHPFQPDSRCEHFSASYTRYRLGGSAPPQVGECLYSNKDRAMFEILEDKVKCHDMLFMACNPSFYARLGQSEHRSCASNMAEAMAKRGFELVKGKGEEGWSGVHDPFNVFQNTPYYSLKALECSRKGDWIEMKVCEEMEQGVIVALSSCPYEEKGFNGGRVTDVGVVWEEL